METTLKLAIETYANITNQTTKDVMQKCLDGNQAVIDSVQMLMFSVA